MMFMTPNNAVIIKGLLAQAAFFSPASVKVHRVGAGKYQDNDCVMSIAEVPDCFDVNECFTKCHPITNK